MNWLERIKAWFTGKQLPEHLRRGALGERAARRYLQQQGLKFLTANFRSQRGEIDLVFRDRDCLQNVTFDSNIYFCYFAASYESKTGNQLCQV